MPKKKLKADAYDYVTLNLARSAGEALDEVHALCRRYSGNRVAPIRKYEVAQTIIEGTAPIVQQLLRRASVVSGETSLIDALREVLEDALASEAKRKNKAA